MLLDPLMASPCTLHPGTPRGSQERVTWTLLCKTNPIMKNKQALLCTKAEDSVKGCRIQFSEDLVCPVFCFPGALRGQAPWKGEGLRSCLSDLPVC